MKIWQAIVLGAVQGLAEFLPISSSGHLILLQHWFNIEENVVFYSVMLHIGTLIPVLAVLWRQILELFKKPFDKMGCLILATIPAGVVGVAFSLAFDLDTLFTEHIWLLSIAFILTAAELLCAEIFSKKSPLENGINAKTAFFMGCGQAFGVFPGISRSGSTITGGTFAKVNKEDNASFTFLMSVPIILAAVALECFKGIKNNSFGSVEALPLLFGVVTAAITGYIAIKFMMRMIKKADYKWFSLYLVAIAVVNLIIG